mmetsp:Transcript_356/g.392  ORF Transcript_356/g.392 Transcript_356/m.392 type:complete len:96 (+) Transcript_356:149-436(+)
MAMIKDEAEFHKKKRMEAVNNANQKSKSSTRAAEDYNKQQIKQLGGIYGQGRPIRKDSMKSSSSNNSSKPKEQSFEVMEIKGGKRNKRKTMLDDI